MVIKKNYLETPWKGQTKHSEQGLHKIFRKLTVDSAVGARGKSSQKTDGGMK